jgi:probable F420-dependent oxidoreductase
MAEQTIEQERADVRSRLGPVGVWSFTLQAHPVAVAREAVVEIEEMGYPAVWFPESVGSKEVLSHAAILLAASSRIIAATGIASIWARDPMAAANGARGLADAFPGRFVLGLGVSHGPSVRKRGHEYERPLQRMREYLDAMDRSRYDSPEPEHPAPRVLAALGPKMLALAAERAAGAHPYFVPVEHTAVAREALGAGPVLCPEQAAVLETDPDVAREIARHHMVGYLWLPNYANNLRRLGWGEEDLADGGSDKLVDALVAWGDVDAIVERVRAHHAAGADHVPLQVLGHVPGEIPLRELRELAPALLA